MSKLTIYESVISIHFADWDSDDRHIYIGRSVAFYVTGVRESKWHNPFTVKLFGLENSYNLYELYIKHSVLYDQLHELAQCELGCWCRPKKCHGDVLRKVFIEKYCPSYKEVIVEKMVDSDMHDAYSEDDNEEGTSTGEEYEYRDDYTDYE